ncbi:hypothetical protein ACS0TY_010438 [Phlomoides rotata]
MIRHPDLIHYACIAKGTIVLAEFNTKDAALGEVSEKCLEKTPPFHATFTHTVRSTTYAFLIDEPFAYFAIFDEKLEKSEGLAFLESVRDAFGVVSKDENSLSCRCFQGEFNPVFRQLLGSGLENLELIGSPNGHRLDESGIHIRGRPKLNNREFRRNGEMKEKDENWGSLSSPVTTKNGGLYSGHQKAKKVWKKQVWVILSLDVIICIILFVVWLWVCRGFKCIDT